MESDGIGERENTAASKNCVQYKSNQLAQV